MSGTFSAAIDHLIDMAENEGNEVIEVETGWEKMRQVVYMRLPISEEVLDLSERGKRLRLSVFDDDPHYPPAVRLIDDGAKVAISFPKAGESK